MVSHVMWPTKLAFRVFANAGVVPLARMRKKGKFVILKTASADVQRRWMLVTGRLSVLMGNVVCI